MNFMTKGDLIIRLRHMKESLFKVEEKIYANGTLEIKISVNRQPPEKKDKFGTNIAKLKDYQT